MMVDSFVNVPVLVLEVSKMLLAGKPWRERYCTYLMCERYSADEQTMFEARCVVR